MHRKTLYPRGGIFLWFCSADTYSAQAGQSKIFIADSPICSNNDRNICFGTCGPCESEQLLVLEFKSFWDKYFQLELVGLRNKRFHLHRSIHHYVRISNTILFCKWYNYWIWIIILMSIQTLTMCWNEIGIYGGCTSEFIQKKLISIRDPNIQAQGPIVFVKVIIQRFMLREGVK